MNKQALVFITLFSLILMLSIYYVTSPIKPADDLIVSDSIEGSIASLQEKKAEKRQQLRQENSTILASSGSSELEKQVALEIMEQLDVIARVEEQLQNSLESMGFVENFVEIEGKQMRIVVASEQENMEDAAKIISVALQQTNQQYAVEVSFRLKS